MNRAERFMAKVSPEPMSGCWLWIAALGGKGYGYFWDGTKSRRAHRVAYEMLRGQIPAGMQIDHLCRVRCCVNPQHMEIVDNRTNVLRGIGLTARHAAKTTCCNRHEFTAGNTYITTEGARSCKACRRDSDSRHRAKERQKNP